MYFYTQYKNLLFACCISYQQSPELGGGRMDIENKTKKLGEDVAVIKQKLTELKNDFEKNIVHKREEFVLKLGSLKKFEKEVELLIGSLESQALLGELGLETLPGIEKVRDEGVLIGIANFREKIYEHKRAYNEYVEESDALKRTLDTMIENKLSQVEIEQYKSIKNIDFLQLAVGERLRFITVGNIDGVSLSSGTIKNIEFTFTYDGVFNRDLYARTTVGQVLPPEVREVKSGNELFIRNGISGEFFTISGKRLKIHEGTKIDVSKLVDAAEIAKLENASKEEVQGYRQNPNYAVALAASRRGIDPKFVLLVYTQEIRSLKPEERDVKIEELLTDIARFQDDFVDDYPGQKSFENKRVTEAFAGYMVHILKGDIATLTGEYGFKKENLETYKKSERYSTGGALKMTKVNIDGVSPDEISSILKLKKFVPGSRQAQILFRVAAQSAGFPESWATHPGLHYILSRESVGVVGVLNYTIPRSYTTQEFRDISLKRGNNNPIGVTSTASGLGQMLLSNVDKYYPDGRSGIGNALSEAVGMLRYIHDRYGSIEVATTVYGKVSNYTHAVTGKYQRKTFREGY